MGWDRHPDFVGSELVAKLWDLEAAYRQLARSPAHASFTVVAVWSPDADEHVYFEQPVLAFGATASVFSFNWVALAVKHLLCVLLRLGATNFYDDYCVLEVAELAQSAEESVEALMAGLGWSLKALPPFSDRTEALGAVLRLEHCREGLAVIENKPKRVEEIVDAIDAMAAAPLVQATDLPRLRGRLLFSRSLCFGRAGGSALRALAAVSAGTARRVIVDGRLARGLADLRRHLLTARPRMVTATVPAPVLIFTDGAFEGQEVGRPVGSVGGILLDPADGYFGFFRAQVPGDIVDGFMRSGAKTVIHELEVLPAVIVRRLWPARLSDRPALAFVDNEGARATLIAGYSTNPSACALASLASADDAQLGVRVWYDRVPSASNPADAPSRLELPPPLEGWARPEEVTATRALGELLTGLVVGPAE